MLNLCCDTHRLDRTLKVLLRVPVLNEAQKNEVDSLNASVAGGILMYEVFRRKNLKKIK